MLILKPGTEVTLLGGIKAVIVAVMIEDVGRVSYKAMWPDGGNLQEKWVEDFIIQKSDAPRVKVGFAV